MPTVQIHQPFSLPKHWATGPVKKPKFTEDESKAHEYSDADAEKIKASLRKKYPSAVIS